MICLTEAMKSQLKDLILSFSQFLGAFSDGERHCTKYGLLMHSGRGDDRGTVWPCKSTVCCLAGRSCFQRCQTVMENPNRWNKQNLDKIIKWRAKHIIQCFPNYGVARKKQIHLFKLRLPLDAINRTISVFFLQICLHLLNRLSFKILCPHHSNIRLCFALQWPQRNH